MLYILEVTMIYLNNAASSHPKPPEVAQAVFQAVSETPHSGARGGMGGDSAFQCRELLCKLFNAPPERFFFTSGATESFNMIIRGLDLHRVVVTAADHNAVLRPLYMLLPEEAILVAPCSKDGIVTAEALERAVSPDTDAVFVNHCSNVTGAIQDLRAAREIAKRNGVLFIVDAAQSAGLISIDLTALDIDILVFTGHKNLFGPAGIGGFYLRDGVKLNASKFGGTGTEGDSVKPNATEMFEVGTPNAPGIAGLAAGLSFVLTEGVQSLGAKVETQIEKIVTTLSLLPNVKVYAPESAPRGGTVGFTIDSLSPADIAYILLHSYDIEIRAGHQCAPLFTKGVCLPDGLSRVSVSAMTPDADIEAFLSAVTELASGVAR